MSATSDFIQYGATIAAGACVGLAIGYLTLPKSDDEIDGNEEPYYKKLTEAEWIDRNVMKQEETIGSAREGSYRGGMMFSKAQNVRIRTYAWEVEKPKAVLIGFHGYYRRRSCKRAPGSVMGCDCVRRELSETV